MKVKQVFDIENEGSDGDGWIIDGVELYSDSGDQIGYMHLTYVSSEWLNKYGSMSDKYFRMNLLAFNPDADVDGFRNYYVDRYNVDYAEVNPEFRGNGYYLKLYQEALKLATKKGIPFYSSANKNEMSEPRWNKYLQSGSIEVTEEEFDYPVSHKRQKISKVNYRTK